MIRLLRYLGFRRVAATWLALALTLVARTTLSAPPESFQTWPYAAQRAAANMVACSYEIAGGIWLAAALSPLRWLMPLKYDRWISYVITAIAAFTSAGAGWLLIRTMGACAAMPSASTPQVLAAVFWAAIVPLSVGLSPHLWIEATERLRTVPILKMWLCSGRGAHAAWIAPYSLRKITEAAPRRLR